MPALEQVCSSHNRSSIESKRADVKLPPQGERFDGPEGTMARRRYQQGRVFLRGVNPPKWIGRWREDVVGTDGKTRRVERSAILGTKKELPTERLARRRLELLVAPINSPDYRPGRIATVKEFSERWTRDVLSQRKPSTIRAAESHLRNQIVPLLGKLRLDEVGREQQQVFVTRLSASLSRKSVLNVLGTLGSMFSTARRWGYVCGKVETGELALPDEGVKTESRFFTSAQAKSIIEFAEEPHRTMFAVAAMTGIRVGELLALTVDDLDFAGRRIFIRRSLHRGNIQSVKSKSSRQPVPMPGVLQEILEHYLATGGGWKETPEKWLFVNRSKKPMSADNLVRRKLWPILDALKIPRCGMHAFRHTLSSLLLETGASPQVTQAQLRHSDPRITLGIYSHVIGDSQRNAVEKVAELLRPTAPNSTAVGEWIQ